MRVLSSKFSHNPSRVIYNQLQQQTFVKKVPFWRPYCVGESDTNVIMVPLVAFACLCSPQKAFHNPSRVKYNKNQHQTFGIRCFTGICVGYMDTSVVVVPLVVSACLCFPQKVSHNPSRVTYNQLVMLCSSRANPVMY
jgi:hypothetical protein